MAIKPAISELKSSNNIVFRNTYTNTDSELVFSPYNGLSKISEPNITNTITNNTISPPRSTSPEAYHPHIINYCTLINSYIKTDFFVPYLSNEYNILPPSVEETYYIL
jgi:hypothetical protein